MERIRLSDQEAALASLGINCQQKGFNSGTAADTANMWHMLQIINDTVFSALSQYEDFTKTTKVNKITGVYNGVTIPAGTVLYGYFTDINLSSGVVQAYSHKKR